MSKQLLLGDEAIAQAALDAGLSGVYAYPGTPSTEITEYIQMAPITTEQNIHNRWCANEKTAMEAALGMSFVGKRALVCMKHVGMNVAADCFVNSASPTAFRPHEVIFPVSLQHKGTFYIVFRCNLPVVLPVFKRFET